MTPLKTQKIHLFTAELLSGAERAHCGRAAATLTSEEHHRGICHSESSVECAELHTSYCSTIDYNVELQNSLFRLKTTAQFIGVGVEGGGGGGCGVAYSAALPRRLR